MGLRIRADLAHIILTRKRFQLPPLCTVRTAVCGRQSCCAMLADLVNDDTESGSSSMGSTPRKDSDIIAAETATKLAPEPKPIIPRQRERSSVRDQETLSDHINDIESELGEHSAATAGMFRASCFYAVRATRVPSLSLPFVH